MSLCVSLGVFFLFYNFDIIGSGESELLKWFMLALSGVFLLAALQPANWKQWTYFYADAEGIHFPDECPSTKSTEWLDVSWTDVGEIKEAMFINRKKGIVLELHLDQNNIDKYFSNLKLTHELLGINNFRDSYFCVGYSNAFINPQKAVSTLNELKLCFQ